MNKQNRVKHFQRLIETVRTGLIASAVVSSWTWAATLLHSSSVAYSYGISGPFWYASGATVQIILFCVVAIELKRRAPFAHYVFRSGSCTIWSCRSLGFYHILFMYKYIGNIHVINQVVRLLFIHLVECI